MSNKHDTIYLNACLGILETGRKSTDRTGVGTTKVAGVSMRFHMKDGFPLLTSKFTPIRLIELEQRMFLNGITDNKFLSSQDVHIWDKFVGDNDELGPIYGAMWRSWPVQCAGGDSYVIDQVKDLMKGLADKPMSRRHVVTGWNPALLPVEGRSHAENVNAGLQALPPCHMVWQVHVFELTVEERVELFDANLSPPGWKTVEKMVEVMDDHNVPRHGVSLQLYQRSADMFLGVPFNIASYSLLLHYIAHSLNMHPLEFIWNGGDCHIYDNHVDQMWEQIEREEDAPASPTILIHSAKKELWDYHRDDFEIQGYNSMPAIKGKMAV